MARVERQLSLADVDAVVLAGGLGTRLETTLEGVPKLLAPIGGRPYLDYLIDWLSRSGVKRLILSLGHLSDKIIQHLGTNPNPAMDISVSVEPAPQGTAGALRFAGHFLKSDPVLVLNGDSYVSASLDAFLAHYFSHDVLGAILCAAVDDADRYGTVDVDRDGLIQGFAEKDGVGGGPSYVSAGVYLLGKELRASIARGSEKSLETDVFARLAPGSLAAMTGEFEFVDIGTPESLAQAQHFFSRHFPRLASRGTPQ